MDKKKSGCCVHKTCFPGREADGPIGGARAPLGSPPTTPSQLTLIDDTLGHPYNPNLQIAVAVSLQLLISRQIGSFTEEAIALMDTVKFLVTESGRRRSSVAAGTFTDEQLQRHRDSYFWTVQNNHRASVRWPGALYSI